MDSESVVRGIRRESVAKPAVKVFQVIHAYAPFFQGSGTDVLHATLVSALNRTHRTPLGAIGREVGSLTDGRTQFIAADTGTRCLPVAMVAGKTAWTAAREIDTLAILVGSQCAGIIRDRELQGFATGSLSQIGQNRRQIALEQLQGIFTVAFPALVDFHGQGLDLACLCIESGISVGNALSDPLTL